MAVPSVALLRRIANGRDTPADRRALADRVRTYLDAAPAGGSLDAAFGLARSAGVMPWWKTEALEARDAALRALANRFHAGRPLARQAVEIRAALIAYSTSSWRFDRRETVPPANYQGTAREMMFDALTADDAVPSARQLRRILRAQSWP